MLRVGKMSQHHSSLWNRWFSPPVRKNLLGGCQKNWSTPNQQINNDEIILTYRYPVGCWKVGSRSLSWLYKYFVVFLILGNKVINCFRCRCTLDVWLILHVWFGMVQQVNVMRTKVHVLFTVHPNSGTSILDSLLVSNFSQSWEVLRFVGWWSYAEIMPEGRSPKIRPVRHRVRWALKRVARQWARDFIQ